MSLSVCLYLPAYLSPFVCLCLPLPVCLYLSLSAYLCTSLPVCIYDLFSFYLWLPVCPCLSVSVSICVSVCLSVCLSICLCLSLSNCCVSISHSIPIIRYVSSYCFISILHKRLKTIPTVILTQLPLISLNTYTHLWN